MKAIIFGATGLVGEQLLDLLLNDPAVTRVQSFTRRKMDTDHPKLQQTVISFSHLETEIKKLEGEVVFCCLGTTIGKAGSQEKFAFVDLELPTSIARLAAQNHISRMVVVSSIGADAKSSNFYLKTKGKMEHAVTHSGVEMVSFVRPSLLLGDRHEYRFGEKAATVLMKLFSWMLVGTLKKYAPIQGKEVAAAMIELALSPSPPLVCSSTEINGLSKKYFKI